MAATKKPRIYFRVAKLIDPESGALVGAIVPAGAADASLMREKGLKVGDLFRADITKPRSYGFHKQAHKLSRLVADSIDGFAGMGAHEALKRLQEEAKVECDVTRTYIPGIGTVDHIKARSIAFDEMEQTAFYAMIRSLSQYISEVYMPSCSAEEVEKMIELMPEEST